MTSIEEAIRSGAVLARVKPLVWNEYETEGEIDRWDAETALGSFYEISTEFDGYSISHDHTHTAQRLDTPDEAKAAAQADYEARILSALSPDPALLALIEERDRLKVEKQELYDGAREAVLSMMWMPGVRAALDQIPEGDPLEPWVRKANEADQWEARALAAEAKCDALREALARAQAWHESEDKALSKSGRNDADYHWRRLQHREQLDGIRAALPAAEYDAAWDRINARALTGASNDG